MTLGDFLHQDGFALFVALVFLIILVGNVFGRGEG